MNLTRAMAALAAEHRAARAPAVVERAVLAEFDAMGRRRNWRVAGVAAVGAALAASVALVWQRPAPARPQIVAAIAPAHVDVVPLSPPIKPAAGKRSAKRVAPDPVEVDEAPFIAIPYTVPLAPDERLTVVRMTLSPPALAAVGFSLPVIDRGGGTQSDVLVGEDGRARAIRFVASSGFR